MDTPKDVIDEARDSYLNDQDFLHWLRYEIGVEIKLLKNYPNDGSQEGFMEILRNYYWEEYRNDFFESEIDAK